MTDPITTDTKTSDTRTSDTRTSDTKMSDSKKSVSNPPSRRIGILILKIVIPMIILVAGAAAGLHLKEGQPKMKKERPKAGAPVVEVMTARPESITMNVTAMGVVIPKREVVLKSQVSGEIDWVSDRFEPGRVIRKGETLLKIDARDYAIAVRRKEGAVASAKASLALEEGNQAVAREELAFIRRSAPDAVEDPSLALRRPQLAQARVTLDLAKADLEQAKLNLSRTTVRAPFTGIMTQRHVTIGSYAGNQTDLATLVAIDEYWIEAAVPLDRLGQLDLARENGVPARITSLASKSVWEGRTVRLTGTFTEGTRMANLIISVTDPLGVVWNKVNGHGGRFATPEHGKSVSNSTVKGNNGGDKKEMGMEMPATHPLHPLMLGDYVQVEIEGTPLERVIALPRYALRENGTVWVVEKGCLTFRSVEIAWKDNEKMFLSRGVAPGDPVILSDLGSPVEGMALRMESVPKSAKEDPASEKKTPNPGNEDAGNIAAVTSTFSVNHAWPDTISATLEHENGIHFHGKEKTEEIHPQ